MGNKQLFIMQTQPEPEIRAKRFTIGVTVKASHLIPNSISLNVREEIESITRHSLLLQLREELEEVRMQLDEEIGMHLDTPTEGNDG